MDVILTRALPQHQSVLAKVKRDNLRRKQAKEARDLSQVKFDDLKKADKDDLLKTLFLKNNLIAPD